MKQTSIALAASLLSTSIVAQPVNFDSDTVGFAPAGWTCGVTSTAMR